MHVLKNFFLRDEAATAVEYAVMLAAIILVAWAGIAALGGANGALYGNIDGEMQAHGIGP